MAAAVSPQVRLHVEERAVASIAANAARQVPGVVALRPGLGRALVGLAGSMLGQARSASDGVDVAVVDEEEGATTATVTVTVRVTITRLGNNCRDLAAAVQQAVTLAVTEQTGLAVRARVTVAEVLLA